MGLAIIVPLRYLFRTGRFGSSVLRMWLGFIIWGALLCVVLPILIFCISRDSWAFYYFPEMPGFAGVVLVGWLPATMIFGIAYGLRVL